MRAERGQGHWRFKLDLERIEWKDCILGEMSIDAASVSDPVLIRGDGQVLYTLASVVDDIEMGVTDVVRGSDHVTNTATQIQMITALGGTLPAFAHHSLLTGPQGEALSKRLGDTGHCAICWAARGLKPAALLSQMARLGSSDPIEVARRPHNDRRRVQPDAFRIGNQPNLMSMTCFPLTGRHLQTLEHSALADEIAALGVFQRICRNSFGLSPAKISQTRHDLAAWWRLFFARC